MSILTGTTGVFVKYGLIALLILAIVGGIFYFGDEYGSNKVQVAAQKATIAQQAQAAADQASLQAQLDAKQLAFNAVSAQLEKDDQALKTMKQAVKVTVIKEIASSPVYKTCVLPTTGPALLNGNADQYNNIIGGSQP